MRNVMLGLLWPSRLLISTTSRPGDDQHAGVGVPQGMQADVAYADAVG
jgi:hypothetical protein